MRTKHTLMLLILVLALGLTSSPGAGKNQDDRDRNLNATLSFAHGSDINCQLQTKSSTVRHAGSGNLTLSVTSNWTCR